MRTKRGIWTAVFLASIVVLCIAGTKISRITQTTTIQGDSLFLVVTGSQAAGTLETRSIEATNLLSALTNFPGWPASGAGGAATNAISTIKVNGTNVSTAATSLNIIAGTNVTVNATNMAGVVDVRINSSASGGGSAIVTNLSIGSTIVIDSVYGSDATGERGNFARPVATPTNAAALAQSGDQIVVRPGLYNLGTNRITLRSNIKWFFEPGAKFTMPDAVNPDGISMFHDEGGAATNCGVYGYGQFYNTNSYGNVFKTTNLLSSVTIDGQDVDLTQAGDDAAIKRVGGDMIINIKGTLRARYDAYIDEPEFAIATNKVVAFAQNIEAKNSIIEIAAPFEKQGDFYFKFHRAIKVARAGSEGGIELTDNTIVEGGSVWLSDPLAKITANGSGGEPAILRNCVVLANPTNNYPTIGYMQTATGGSRIHFQHCFLNLQTLVDPVIMYDANGLTFEDTTVLAGSSATNIIRSAAARTVKVLGSFRYNKPFHPNVTTANYSSTTTNIMQQVSIPASGALNVGGTLNVTGSSTFNGISSEGDINLLNGANLLGPAGSGIAVDYIVPNLVTASRAAVIGPDGIMTNVVSSSPSTEYVKADGTVGTPVGSGDVTAAATIADNRIVRGDGGAKGIQQSPWTIDDSGNLIINGAAKTNAALINAGTGPNQYANLVVNTNLTDYISLAGSDATNSLSTKVSFTQDSTGTRTLTFMGRTIGVDTNALATTYVEFWVQNGATNASWSIPRKTGTLVKGDALIYDGTNFINVGSGLSNGQVLTKTNVGVGWYGSTPSGSGEANVNGEISVTNATRVGLVYGKAGVTNLLRSIQSGLNIVVTNEGTNIVIASTGGSGSTNLTTLASGSATLGSLKVTNALSMANGQFQIKTEGGLFSIYNDTAGSYALTVNTNTDAIIVGSAGFTPSIVLAANSRIVGVGEVTSTNFVGTLALPNVAANSVLATGSGSNVVAATQGWGISLSGGAVTLTNRQASIATNATSVTVGFSDAENIQILNAWFHLTTNLVVSPTNLIVGRTMCVYFDTNSLTYDVTVTNAAATPVRWNFNVSTNGSTSFTKTNTLRARVFLTAETNGIITAEMGYYR